MNIIQQLLRYSNMDLENTIDKAIKNIENRLIKIKKLKNKERKRKGIKRWKR